MIGKMIFAFWILLALYGILKCNIISINILFIMCILQNTLLVLSSPYITNIQYSIFVIIKEIYVLMLIAIKVIKETKITHLEALCFVYISVVVAYGLLFNNGSTMGTLASIRQLYLPFVFFLLGSLYYKDINQIIKSCRLYVVLMSVAAIFGIVEMIMGDSLWIRLGYSSYAQYKGIDYALTGGGVSGAFYSWDLGIKLRRMASFLADPVILGQLIAFALIVSIFCKNIIRNKAERFGSIVLLAFALVFSMAKGGIIIAAFAFVFIRKDIGKNKKLSIIYKILFVAGISVGILYVIKGGSEGGLMHIKGLTDNLMAFPNYPLGRGVGTIGGVGYLYSGRVESSASGESFFGAVIGQIGIVGMIIYGLFYSRLFFRIRSIIRQEQYYISRIILWLNVGLFATAWLNNTAISFTSCFIYYIMAGAIIKVSKYQETVLVRRNFYGDEGRNHYISTRI